MSDFVKTFVQRVIENPACINWDYFLNFGVTELLYINDALKTYMTEDSKLYLQLHDVVTKSLKGKQIDYELILEAMSEFLSATRGRVEILDEYISAGPFPDPFGIENLNISVRSYNCLKWAGYTKIEEVIRDINTENFKNIKNLTATCIQEIEEAIRKWAKQKVKKRKSGFRSTLYLMQFDKHMFYQICLELKELSPWRAFFISLLVFKLFSCQP